jgi:hypothetical protein
MKDRLEAVRETLERTVGNDFNCLELPDLMAERDVVQKTRFMLLPDEWFESSSDIYSYVKQLRGIKLGSPKSKRALQEYKRWCMSNHKVNPCLFDFSYWKESGSTSVRFLLLDLICSFYASDMISAPKTIDAFEYFGRLFWRACRCFSDKFKPTIRLNIHIGDVYELLYTQPRSMKYHRIMLSNIPDHCGILAAFLLSAQRLKENSNFPCWFAFNCMLNTGIFEDTNEFIFSATVLNGTVELKQILGIRLRCGELWGEDFCWQVLPDAPPPNRKQVASWLRRLFLAICYPAQRSMHTMIVEYSPMNMNVFMLTLKYLIEYRSVPAHFIMEVLLPLISNPIIMTTEPIPEKSPNPRKSLIQRRQQKVVLETFQQELRCIMRLWADELPCFLTVPLPTDVGVYVFPNVDIDPTMTSHLIAPSSAIFFCNNQADGEMGIFSYYEGIRKPKRLNQMHVFTVTKKHGKHGLAFLAPASLMDSLAHQDNDWMVVAFRTDMWTMIATPLTPKDIQRVQ